MNPTIIPVRVDGKLRNQQVAQGGRVAGRRQRGVAPLFRRKTMVRVTLRENEKVLIGNDISVMVVEIRGGQIRLGIQAPADIPVLREKVARKGEA
jgi:carbon storage regulator